ncbi:MAG: sensor histidine kinase [Agriterribacter sp.]
MRKRITILLHIVCWLIYILLPIALSPGFGNRSVGVPHIMGYPMHMLIFNLSLIPFFYLNSYVLVPKFFFTNKNLIYFLCILAFLLLSFAIPLPERHFIMPVDRGNMPFVNPQNNPFPRPQHGFFRYVPRVFTFLLVWLLGTMLQVTRRWQLAEKKSRESELEKVKAELSYLKLQINPHFLFNTLNNIYSLASVQSTQTSPAVMKLSEIMRYVIYDAQADYVPLDKEIEYIRNYIELQKMRSNDKLLLTFDTSGDIAEPKIAPLILLSFIENAFKYGISNHEKSNININIAVSDGTLQMMVSNTIFNRPGSNQLNSIGIPNSSRRLELLYPNKHALKMNRLENIFTVDLKIDLT